MNDDKRKTLPHLHMLKPTLLFFATGMIVFLVAMASAVRIIPDLVHMQSVRNPQGWFLAHLLLLGFASMIAMGASFQLTQVILRTALFSRAMAYVQYVLCVSGFCGLLAGFFADARLIAVGGWGIAAGGVLYVVNLAMTVVRKKEWNVFVFGVGLCLAAYLITLFLGIAMGLGFAYGWNAGYYEQIFGSHIWFGIGGWLAGIILVYSYKLLPMFYVSRKKWTSSPYWVLGMFHVGVWMQPVSLWTGSDSLAGAAALLMLFALGWFIMHIREIRNQSSGKQPIGAVKVAFYLIPASCGLFLAWNVWTWFGFHTSLLNEALLIWLILGWIAPTILSYLSKILPFLWWAHRYRTKEEKKSAILLSDMLPEQRMTRELYGYLLGIAGVVAGALFGLPFVVALGQAAAVLCVLIYVAELLRVFRY